MSKMRRGETVKKKASGRSSVQAMIKGASSTSAQSAAARRAAKAQPETQLHALIKKCAPAPSDQRLIGAMRKSLRKRLPSAHEVVYEYGNLGAVVISFSPSEQGYEGVLAIRADADGVKLYFTSGKELPDPQKLLQ